MRKNEIQQYDIIYLGCILLIGIGLLFPYITNIIWFNIILKIRRAINTGDSGLLILSAASMNFLSAIQSTLLFLGVTFILYLAGVLQALGKFKIYILSLSTIISLHALDSLIFRIPWEPVSTIISLVLSICIFDKFFDEKNSILHISIVSIQVFFAFQWLNIMPIFSSNYIGISDIACSIKVAGAYLHSSSILNFIGFAFFLPFIFSAFITSALFASYLGNIKIIKQNYEKENEIQSMKSKILENRILKEVKSLVHDLKTPLVTIQGLNSLLSISMDTGKLEEYSERIENSVSKMNEMISSFLYDTSRQKINTLDLISYIRAQLPLEDDSIEIEIKIHEKLPCLYINKIRIARAIINILENAIIVPCSANHKHISFEVKPICYGLNIIVSDNGVGIKESELPHIWDIGYSTNNTSGLGLSFVKQVIEDNQGTVEILSKPEEGTVVSIYLPSADKICENSN